METSVIIGLVLSSIGALILLVSGFANMLRIPVVIKNTEHIGFPLWCPVPFGAIKIVIGILILAPWTSLIGVILATGWMGGAIAAHIRVGDKFFLQAAIPTLIWVGFGLSHQSAMHILLGI